MIQLLWSIVLTGHAVCAALWWWISPGGFPTSSTEYWLNSVLPIFPIVLVPMGLFARGKVSEALVPPLFTTFPLFWMTYAISFRIAYPDSAGATFHVAFLGGFVLAFVWIRQYRFRITAPWLVPFFAVPAIWAGWSLAPTSRSAPPSTHPAGGTIAEATTGTEPKLTKLGKDAQLHPDDGRLVMRRGDLVLTVQSLPAFLDRSPDRAPTSWAPDDLAKHPTVRQLVSFHREGARTVMLYKDENRSELDVSNNGAVIELDARSSLSQDVYTHESRYAELTLRGHKKLSVGFSPVSKRVEPPTPTAQKIFAYVDAQRTFHVVECDKRNLGPFKELASGPIARDAPLEVTLFDGDSAVFKIALADFVAQASTELSPIAGWGVPQNIVELVRAGDPENAPAAITFSLAETTVGRGTNSVGHTAGTYRDRITVTPLR